ncbi:hypothetical protein HBH98_117920 [Parastagonospora nodorum]|nr:hypothetical protein HBH98_117920 [Parastagonospora nodorum]KAH4378302.1 hypothetical protein HBH97_101000 [Parastagonospora nodorum]KAH4395689.1 hypothetical protein HBH99_129730 [Parastagonospora nodorum]
MQRETRTHLRYTLSKELKLMLNTLLLGSNKSLLFLALACLKDLGVLVILSSKELLALVILRLLEAPSNSAQSLLTLMLISLSYSYVTALLRA